MIEFEFGRGKINFEIILPELPLLSPIQHALSVFKLFALILFKSFLLLVFVLTPSVKLVCFCVGIFFLNPNDIAVPLVSTDRERFLLSVWPYGINGKETKNKQNVIRMEL